METDKQQENKTDLRKPDNQSKQTQSVRTPRRSCIGVLAPQFKQQAEEVVPDTLAPE